MTMPINADNPSLSATSSPDFLAEPAKPFAIGLKPLDDNNFLQIDNDFVDERRQKIDLYSRIHNEICVAEPATLGAQSEVEALILNCLKTYHEDLYEFREDGATCKQTGTFFPHDKEMPISSIGLLIPEDLVLMRRDETGWRLVAASLSFPASWSLKDKFSKPLEAVHGPVPLSDQMSQRIRRIFDHIKAELPVWRTNWSLGDDSRMRQERREADRSERRKVISSDVYFRTELQTLHKLPASGDILFTISTKIRPIKTLVNDEAGRRKLAILQRQYFDMNDAERDYKGINRNADGLLAWLEENGTVDT
ncbi:MAG: DUF3445 domain-containing protein [Rhizobiaceae bacterium]